MSDDAIKVTLLDTKTGDRYEGPPGWTAYWWADGNGSCDCNRDVGSPETLAADAAWMADGLTDAGDDVDHACVSVRYLVVAVDPMPEGYTLADFNRGYPRDLIIKRIGPEGLREEDR